MALYELVLNLQYLEQRFVNRWNYISDSVPGDPAGAFGLVQALGLYTSGSPQVFPVGTMGAAIQAILNEQTIFVQAFAKNVYDPLDFYDYAFVDGVVGGVAGAGLSPVLAIGFTSSRVRTDIRRGQKRFGGVDGDWVGNGGALTGTAITACNTLSERMSEIVTYDNGASVIAYNGCIVGKERVAVPGDPVRYQYYPTLAEQEDHLAVGVEWSVKPDIRTQGSRQYLRGI
jgi:hypothetical protein